MYKLQSTSHVPELVQSTPAQMWWVPTGDCHLCLPRHRRLRRAAREPLLSAFARSAAPPGAASIAPGCSRGGKQAAAAQGTFPLPPSCRSTPQHTPLLLSLLPAFHPVSPVCHNPFSVCSPGLSWHANLINTLSVSPCWLLMGVLNSSFPAPQ